MMADATAGTVLAYGPDGNTMQRYEVAAGAEVDWKRNGTVGAYRAQIIAFRPGRGKIRPLYHTWTGSSWKGRPVWVKPRFLRVYSPGGG